MDKKFSKKLNLFLGILEKNKDIQKISGSTMQYLSSWSCW